MNLLNVNNDNQTEKPNKKGFEKILLSRKSLIITSIILIAIIIPLLIGYFEAIQRPEIQYYFQETFQEKGENWNGVDYSWDKENNLIQLSRQEYLAPNIMFPIPLEQAPQELLVFHFRVNVSKYTDNALTLGALVFPQGSLALIINDDGNIGIARELFDQPKFVDSIFNSLSNDEWQDIHVYVNSKKDLLQIYLNNHQVLSEQWDDEIYPLQEIWLGSIWLKGPANYGAPLDLKYDSIEIANEGLVPKPSFMEYIKLLFLNIF